LGCPQPGVPVGSRAPSIWQTGGRWFEKKFKIIDELALELDAFAESIRRNHEPEPNGVQGMRDVAVMEAIYQSAREGRAVPISMPE